VVLYQEYLDRLRGTFLLGQGLGLPVSRYYGDAFWADITVVTFAIPFGVFGLGVLAGFLRRVYRQVIGGITDPRIRNVYLLIFLLALGMSFNDDIWSHKFFVVYFVCVVNSLPRLHRSSPTFQPLLAVSPALGDDEARASVPMLAPSDRHDS
jgi:hypothetical protein